MGILKIITTRNAFSREYGTWIIMVLNLLFVPVCLGIQGIAQLYFSLAAIFFLAFRFEILDIYAIHPGPLLRKQKLIRAAIYLVCAGVLFVWMIFAVVKKIDLLLLLIIPVSFIFLAINIITRRKSGRRQALVFQLLLMLFASLVAAFNYYIITFRIDAIFWMIILCNMLYFSVSVIYVRSKTEGSPNDIIAMIAALAGIFVMLFIGMAGWAGKTMFIIFIPSFIRTLDNVILLNVHVPLKRIGVSETIHGLIFLLLCRLLFSV